MPSLPALFSFEGRARRAEWWLTIIGVTLLGSLVITVVSLTASGGDWSSLASNDARPGAIVVLNLAVSALVLWIQTAVGVRRSHDRGQSGVGLIVYLAISYGWSFIPMVVVAVGLDLPPIPFAGAFLFAFAFIGFVCGLYFLITLGFLEGESTANAYGRSPRSIPSGNDAAPRLGD